jgi:outer membrane protein assembly factor BamB
MKRLPRFFAACTALALPLAGGAEDAADRTPVGADHQWGQWRGPLGTGVGPHADPPIEWSETKNVRWKTPLPGLGHSTPVVWGDRIFLTTAIPYGEELDPQPDTAPGAHDNAPVTRRHEFAALAVARRDGKVLWQRTLHKDLPLEGHHYTGSFASSSPASDGERVYAFFGSHGLYCLDAAGELQWKRSFGRMRPLHGHGEGCSPVLHGETLVINWDHEAGSFVAALDKRTGKERWRVPRDEPTSWATPIVAAHGSRTQLVISGTNRVRAYDLATGDEIWQCGGLSQNVVASPVAGGGMVFAGSSYEKQAMVAVRLDGARGDVTGTEHVAWTRNRGAPYVPSPLLLRDSLYFLRHYQGVLIRVDPRTGKEPHSPTRLEGMRDIYASPVAAAGRVYVTDRGGATIVLRDGSPPAVLARNQLDDRFSASAALAGKELYLRGERHLYCIAQE